MRTPDLQPAAFGRRFGVAVPAACAVILAVIVLCAGCESSPDASLLDNPFDPEGSLGGDALQVQAIATANAITLRWNQPQGFGIVEYNVLVSDNADGGFGQLAVVAATEASTAIYSYKYPPPAVPRWFKVQAVTEDGRTSAVSAAVPAVAIVGPTVVVGDTLTSLASRYQDLSVTAGFGDTILVATDSLFADALAVPVADPTQPTVFAYDFGAATDSTEFVLRVKAVSQGLETPVTNLTLPVDFDPTITIVDGTATRLARRVNDLAIPAAGVVRMRFAGSEPGLTAAPWVPGADVYPGYELEDSANPQVIWGEFEGDFGFNVVTSLNVRPDLLLSAGFRLKLSGTSRVVSRLTVVGEHTAGATQMRVSENPNFADVPWAAYADTASFQLSPGEGTKTVYAQYRNDWTESIIFSDYCIYVAQGVDVKILVPAPGSVLEGGSTLVLRGTATPGTVAAELDSVRIELGDGNGFREVVGTTDWQLTWPVPEVTADTDLVIRARAWAHSPTDTFVATDAITVTLSQLRVAITAPADGAVLAGGADIALAGTAGPLLGGAAVDSVVVDAGDTHLVASGTESWSATWPAPAVAADTPTVITATAWAGGEAVSATIGVTLTP